MYFTKEMFLNIKKVMGKVKVEFNLEQVTKA
jgi:hypothetical protein